MKEYCTKEDIKILHPYKLYLDDLYYNTDESPVTDKMYDILKDTLVERDPEYIPPVGAKIRTGENRVKIPFWMGSIDKITPSEQKKLDRWLEKNKCRNVFISEKLDGVSGTFTHKDGQKRLYTRGNGEIGADISYLIQYMPSIPTNIDVDIAVRGELIIKKDIFFQKYRSNKKGKSYKHSRNMVSGLIGAKTIREGLRDLEFVVYEIIGTKTMPKPSKQFKILRKMGFTVATNIVCKSTNMMFKWVSIHNKLKTESKYEIDGIVVQSNVEYDRNTSGNPSYIFAFKVLSKDMIVETKVIDIEWSVSSWGHIIPVAIIEPVELPGVTISRVTLSNAGLMKEKCIGPGSIVNVTRSKEVIPFIVSVIRPCQKLKWPDIEYEWSRNFIHINVVEADQNVISGMKIKFFTKFFAKMGIKHVSSQTISKLYHNGFDTILKICSVSKKDLLTIDGIKEKSAYRIVNNIQKGLQNINVPQLLGAASVFGFGIGQKKVITLMNDIPDLLSGEKKEMKDRILKVEGFSDITTQKVYENIDVAIEFVDAISKLNFISFTEQTRVSDDLVGRKFVFSGFRNKELEQNIIDRGGNISSSVSKKTSGIIVENKNKNQSSKVKKAIEFSIPVYTKEEFITKFI